MNGVDLSHYKRIVQGFFDAQPRFDDSVLAPIWCLGVSYTHPEQSQTSHAQEKTHQAVDHNLSISVKDETPTLSQKPNGNPLAPEPAFRANEKLHPGWPQEFLDDCESRFWFTYRSNFPAIAKAPEASMTLSVRLRSLTEREGFTSDTGWGCMIRSGQSVLANALSILRLGREWRCRTQAEEERKLVSLFADHPDAPFSIHKFVEHGAEACGKHPGEWFGPSATARCIQALSNDWDDAGVCVYVNGDGSDVYEDAFLKTAMGGAPGFTPCLILLGVRLGIDRVTPAYWESLRYCLDVPQSVGIAGGRPSSSHYFFAHRGDSFFYLDPHFTRPALPLHDNAAELTTEEVDSCHTRKLRMLEIADMDPSMLLAFLIKDMKDWTDWCSKIRGMRGKALIHIADHAPPMDGHSIERRDAVDEVETIDDEDDFRDELR